MTGVEAKARVWARVRARVRVMALPWVGVRARAGVWARISVRARPRVRVRVRPRVMARVGLELGVWPRWCRLYLWSIPHLCVIDSKLWLPG